MGLRRKRLWRLVELVLAWMLGLGLVASGLMLRVALAAQAAGAPAIATTMVTDTVYRADGTAASGTVLIGWGAFSTAGGSSVPAGSTSVTLGAGGKLAVALVPNAGSTPMGSYYTVVYHLDDGSVTREYWVVPATPANQPQTGVPVSAIKSTVLPASVAMQTVSKAYVDSAIAAAVTGHPEDSSPYVLKSGDTMTGPLNLPGDPVAPLQAADMQYVDEQTAALQAGLGQKVATQPQGAQTVVQPGATQLAVNNLNGTEYASQYVSGAGNNGIANATASASCTSGCDVVAEQTYASAEPPKPTTWNNQTHVEDLRGGGASENFFNPLNGLNTAQSSGVTVNRDMTQPIADVAAATGQSIIGAAGVVVNMQALAGGTNTYAPQVQATVPYFKSTYTALQLAGTNNTSGQHVLTGANQNCYGVGDCLIGGDLMASSGGFRDAADEGAHAFDLLLTEDATVFTGTCASGCAAGATRVQVSPASGQGTEGEGRYLMDTNPAKVIRTGLLTGGSSAGRQPSATFTGTNFPVSTFLETAQVITSQANHIEPGTVTVPIVTSGVPAGFASNTAALPAATGVACVADIQVGDGRPTNFETSAYTVVDGSHVQLTLVRPHATGATLAVGGLCGYGLEQTVDTTAGLRQVFPVVGSTSATSLVYAGSQTPLAGMTGLTSGFANVTLVIASAARTGGVVTVTLANALGLDVNGLTLTVSGVADASYNGSFVVTTTSSSTLTYADAGPDSTSAGGQLTLLTGGYALYPMAEALSVYNATSKAVDGLFTLAANTVPWAVGDTVEQPHYFQQNVHADQQEITQYVPRPAEGFAGGILYQGLTGYGLSGWAIVNGTPVTSYYGNGGTHTAPGFGMGVSGVWTDSLSIEAGENAAIAVHCNSHGCSKWNSGYDLFQMDTSSGVDHLSYAPQTSTLTIGVGGTGYVFNPNSFTAPTINVGALNATTVNGKFIGTVQPQSLPVFGASGSSHAQGAVPDPGASGGTTRFLREDGSWAAVSATGSGSTTIASSGGASFSTSGPINFPDRASLLAEYLLNEGSGATAHDTSGQGNNGTIVGPAWEGSADLDFEGTGEYVQLPTALNAAQAWQFAFYLPPFGTQTSPQAPGSGGPDAFPFYPSLLCGTDRAHLCLLANSTLASRYLMRFDAFSTDGTESAEPVTAGWHVFTLLCGSNVNGVVTKTRYLFDGAEAGSYLSQGDAATCPVPATGNYQLGGADTYAGQSYWHGKIAATWAWSTHLSLADGVAAANSALEYLKQKGVQTEFRKLTATTPQIVAGMDSRTFGLQLTPATVWPATMQLTDSTYTRVNLGVSGAQVQDLCPQFDLLYGSYLGRSGAPSIVMLWGGVNDLQQTVQTPRQIANALHCMVTKSKAAGARVVLATEISSLANQGTTGDTGKDALDTILRAEAFSWGVDNLADLATDVHLGADGASANTSCFPDNLHPGPSCEPYVTAVMQDAVNELIGSSETSRHQTAAASYSEIAGDRYLDLTGTSSQAVALPDCTGYSLKREVVNLGTASASVSANGLVGAGTLGVTTLNAGTRAVFVPIPGALSTAGCHWERVE